MTSILIVTSSFPRYQGDYAGIFLYDLAKHLAEQGLNVHILAPHDHGFIKEEKWGRVNIHRFGYVPFGVRPALCYGSGIPYNLRHSYAARFQIPLYFLNLIITLWRLVRREKIKIINSHWLLMQGVGAALLQKTMGIPHICTVHSSELSVLSRLPFGNKVAAFTLHHTDHLICVSGRTQQRLEKIVQAPVDATIIPMGIDVPQFRNKTLSREAARQAIGAQAKHNLLFVGRLAEMKGINYLLQTLPSLQREFPDLELFLVGSGYLEQELKDQVNQLGLGEVVKFTGRISHQDLPIYYRAADAVVIPSIVSAAGEEEGMPVVLMEALAAGCKVVATRTGGMPEIIRDSENGFLASPADAASLEQAIRRALLTTDNPHFERLAAKTAQLLDWSRIAGSYRKIAEQLANSIKANEQRLD